MREYLFGVSIFLLLVLIGLSLHKLRIFFETFMFLQKTQNYDKANYISNSSFVKYYYRDDALGGYLGVETAYFVILFLLSFFAFIGWALYGHMNCGYLSYYYGDTSEYYFIYIFICFIIFLMVINAPSFVSNALTLDGKDGILEIFKKKENELKEFLANNIDYDLLYDYYEKTKVNDNYTLLDKELPESTASQLYNYCFTYHILTEKGNDTRFSLIKAKILDIVKGVAIDETKDRNEQLKTAIIATDFNIVALYNHNNNVVLPSLQNILGKLKKKANSRKKKRIGDILAGMASIKLGDLSQQHDTAIDKFRETIKMYKKVYEIYIAYFMISVLLTNFFVSYAILVLIYIIIKCLSYYFAEIDDAGYNIYYYIQYLVNNGVYMLCVYYFLTSPMIIFGFN
jgi:hypothetical protein